MSVAAAFRATMKLFKDNQKLCPPEKDQEGQPMQWSFMILMSMCCMITTYGDHRDRLWVHGRGIVKPEKYHRVPEGYEVEGKIRTIDQLAVMKTSDANKDIEVGHFRSVGPTQPEVVSLIQEARTSLTRSTQDPPKETFTRVPTNSVSEKYVEKPTEISSGPAKVLQVSTPKSITHAPPPAWFGLQKPKKTRKPHDPNKPQRRMLCREEANGDSLRWFDEKAAARYLGIEADDVSMFLVKGEHYKWFWEKDRTVKQITEGKYQGLMVTNKGEIWLPNGDEVTPSNRGEKHVVMLPNFKSWKRVDRIVCLAFHGPPPHPKAHVVHIDGNHWNDKAKNLQWQTESTIVHCFKGDRLIQTYDSVEEAADMKRIHKSTIFRCLKGERKTAGGFSWSR